jgi:hypothetical protein
MYLSRERRPVTGSRFCLHATLPENSFSIAPICAVEFVGTYHDLLWNLFGTVLRTFGRWMPYG